MSLAAAFLKSPLTQAPIVPLPEKEPEDKNTFADLVARATPAAYRRLLGLLDNAPTSLVRWKDKETQNTLLHCLVQHVCDLYRRNKGNVSLAVCLCYKLSVKGCDINAQNVVGNTALHMACFRPHGDLLAQHLIRLGLDTGVMNNAGCRVIHHNEEHKCWLVKGQKSAKCSIWSAVAREDKELIAKYLNSWCRVNTRRKRKSLIDVAYETGSYDIVQQLLNFRNTNELVVCALGCDAHTVQKLLRLKSDPCNLKTKDYSHRIPKPLMAELQGLLPATKPVLELLQRNQLENSSPYFKQLNALKGEFESFKFHELVTSGGLENLQDAWTEVDEHRVYVNALRMDDATYLHLLVEQYLASEDISCKRALIRLMYKMTLEGIDVQRRNAEGKTALVSAYQEPPDRHLLDHLVRMGVDSSIRSNDGHCVSVNTFATRGELVLRRQTNRRYMPGLWVAVEDGNVVQVRHWLSDLCRANTTKAGRSLLQLARDLGFAEVAALLEEQLHITEFVTASMAGDVKKMKHYIAMGNGLRKVNASYAHHFAGFTDDWKAEFVVRPLIVNVMECCPAVAVSYLVQFGARLDVHYDECAPCGPVAFWAFRDDISHDVCLTIASTANMALRDEGGATLLHRAILRSCPVVEKRQLVAVMLERGASVAARDLEGRTPRDYCDQGSVSGAEQVRQIIDDFVLNLAYVGNYDGIEQLILEGYDHITDIRGTERMKSAKELAFLRYYKELLELLDEIPRYQKEIEDLHRCVIRNDVKGFTRFASEKKVAWGIDKRGRNMLHLATLYRHHEIVASICEQFPQLLDEGDNLDRTPPHYAVSLRDQRATLAIMSANNTLDMTRRDANNLSVLDYTEQVERPIHRKLKPRGRRVLNYQPQDLVSLERSCTKDLLENCEEPPLIRRATSEIRPRTAL